MFLKPVQWKILLVLALVVLVGCDDDQQPSGPLVGTWDLVSARVFGQEVEGASGFIMFTEKTFRLENDLPNTAFGNFTQSGTYTVDGSLLSVNVTRASNPNEVGTGTAEFEIIARTLIISSPLLSRTFLRRS